MAEIAIGPKQTGAHQTSRQAAAARPTEGLVTLLLHITIIAMTANSVVRVDQGDRTAMLIPLAIGGLLLGGFVARTPALDAVAHLLALLTGAFGALVLFTLRTDGVRATWDDRGRNVYGLARKVVEAQASSGSARLTDDDLLVVIGVTLWLVGYSSAWMLYRRHWLMPALLVPAVLVFVNLRFENQESTGSIAVFTVCALIMTARHQAFVRQMEWSRARVPSPPGLSSRFTAGGTVVALVALFLGWALPFQAQGNLFERLSDRFQNSWEWVQDELNDLGGPSLPAQYAGSGYDTFAESFRLGGEIELSSDPVASLEAAEPTYLAARRYDEYDGGGWLSEVDKTFRMDGEGEDVNATSVTFTPNQNVALSTEVNNERAREAGVITVLSEGDGLLLTTDTFVSASINTVAILGWKQISGLTIDIESVDAGSLPVDLQGLVVALRDSEFVPDPASGLPVAADPASAQLIEGERARLRQYPIETSLSFSETGEVVLTVSGRLPNYDDIEAVFAANAGARAGRYRVIGTASVADIAALNSAGTNYPAWVTSRYLQLPDSITPEISQLAAEIVAGEGAQDPFDKAWAIQEFLHNTYQYALNSEDAPDGRDYVDFFLFGKRIGRCTEFATAMVVMLRTQGVPARLVAGYRASEETNAFGEYIYRGTQAHTWVEVYFPGYGWIPFEPTRGQAPFDYGGASAPTEAPLPDEPVEIEPTPTVEPEVTPEATPTAAPVIGTVSDDGAGGSLTDRLTSKLGIVSLALTGLAALIVVGFAAVWAWGLRGLRPGAALYARTIRIGTYWGVEPDPAMTPHEYAAEFGQVLPRASGAVRYVAELYSAEKYGGIEITDEAQRGGQEAWRAVRAGMLSWRPWRRRHPVR